MNSPSRYFTVIRISARVSGLLLFIFWGSFFIEHMSWFISPSEPSPPMRIWLLQAVHLVLIAGYLVLLRWEKTGSLMVIVSAVLFFSFAAGEKAAPFILVSILPALLMGYCHWLEKRIHPPHTVV